ncbi:MAG: hypothetical protein AB7F50_02485 [Fimbriimonadaceae bacterium]
MSAHAHATPVTLGFRQAELRIGGKVAYFGTRPVPDDGVWGANWDHVRANTGAANAECLYYASHGNHDANGFLLLTDTDDAVNFYEPGNNFPTIPHNNSLQTIVRDTVSSTYEFPVRPVVQGKVGNGVPPFNDGGPPLNLVFLMACCCAATNSPAEAYLWPYRNAYQPPGSPVENKAAAGWDAPFALHAVSEVATRFYSQLLEGRTVDEARDHADDWYQHSPLSDPDNGLPANLIVWGGFHTRTSYLYTGTSSKPVYPRPFARTIPAYAIHP